MIPEAKVVKLSEGEFVSLEDYKQLLLLFNGIEVTFKALKDFEIQLLNDMEVLIAEIKAPGSQSNISEIMAKYTV